MSCGSQDSLDCDCQRLSNSRPGVLEETQGPDGRLLESRICVREPYAETFKAGGSRCWRGAGAVTSHVDISRGRDNANSQQVFRFLEPSITELQGVVLAYLGGAGPKGMTVKELAHVMGYGDKINRVSGRLSELQKLGKAYQDDSIPRREKCGVWRVA
jgi:hypothetical protein